MRQFSFHLGENNGAHLKGKEMICERWCAAIHALKPERVINYMLDNASCALIIGVFFVAPVEVALAQPVTVNECKIIESSSLPDKYHVLLQGTWVANSDYEEGVDADATREVFGYRVGNRTERASCDNCCTETGTRTQTITIERSSLHFLEGTYATNNSNVRIFMNARGVAWNGKSTSHTQNSASCPQRSPDSTVRSAVIVSNVVISNNENSICRLYIRFRFPEIGGREYDAELLTKDTLILQYPNGAATYKRK